MLEMMTQHKFSIMIEETVRDKGISYMDAIVWWCENNEVEVEAAAKLCNIVIREKIRYEAEELNFLEKPARLPI